MKRRTLFAFAPAIAAAPAALLKSPVVEMVAGDLAYPTESYEWKTFSAPFGAAHEYHRALLHSMNETWERHTAKILNENMFASVDEDMQQSTS